MISEARATKYCFEDISLIENYEAAMADQTQTWHCHHRWETDRGLSPEELIFCCEYDYVPADRLIFLTKAQHKSVHNIGNNWFKGHKMTKNQKRKVSIATKEAMARPEVRAKLDSPETKRKISAGTKGTSWWNNGKISVRRVECPEGFVAGRLKYN